MKKFLSVAMCLALGLTVAGCEMPNATEVETDTPAVEVEVDGEAVEVVLPAEAVEAIDEALMDAEPVMPEEMPMEEEMAE